MSDATAAEREHVAMLEGLDHIVRMPQVEMLTTLQRSSIHRMIRNGSFPAPLKLGKRAIGWRSSDIAAWMSNLKVSTAAKQEI